MPALFDTGFSVRTPAWHQMTNVVMQSPDNWADARKAADIDKWEVAEGPVFGYQYQIAAGTRVWDPRDVVLAEVDSKKLAREVSAAINKNDLMRALELIGAVPIEDKKRTLRTDTGATFGVPTQEYEVIGLDEIGDICKALTEAMATATSGGKRRKVKVEYDALVSLEGGKSIVATLILKDPVQLKGDPSKTLPLLVVSTRNDGTGAAKAMTGSIRVICANTRTMMEGQAEANKTVFTFKHGAGWQERLDEAVQTLLGLREQFDAQMEYEQWLLDQQVTPKQTQVWLDNFLPYPSTRAHVESDKAIQNVDDRRATVLSILNHEGGTCEGIRGTAFGWLAAGTEYCDFYADLKPDGTTPRSIEARVKRTLIKPDVLKRRQVEIIKDVLALGRV